MNSRLKKKAITIMVLLVSFLTLIIIYKTVVRTINVPEEKAQFNDIAYKFNVNFCKGE